MCVNKIDAKQSEGRLRATPITLLLLYKRHETQCFVRSRVGRAAGEKCAFLLSRDERVFFLESDAENRSLPPPKAAVRYSMEVFAAAAGGGP